MNPNTDQITAIRGFVEGLDGGWTKTDEQILAAMVADLVPNPVAQAQVPAAFTAASVFGSGQIAGTSVAKLVPLPSFASDVVPLLNVAAKSEADLTNLLVWAGVYLAAGSITQAEHDYLTGLFTGTVADPAYRAEISWDLANLGRAADLYDIEMARHN